MLLITYPWKICVPSKTKEVNVKVLNMIKRTNEVTTLVKYISGKFKFNSVTCNSNRKRNNDKRQCHCKKYCVH